MKNLFLHKEKIQLNNIKENEIICKKCNGLGKLDWIKNIVGK